MNKKLLSLLLALVMVFSFIPAFAAEEAPKAEDKKAEEAAPKAEEKKAEEVAEPAKAEVKDYIKFLQDGGYVKGDKKGDLMLDKNLTRAEFTALLARLDGKDDVAKAMQQLGGRFTDVTEAHWAKGYISYATGRGWVQGYPDGTFKPEANISYAEIATVLVRFLDVDTNGFNWPVDFIAKAFDLGLMKGLPEIKDYKQAAVRDNMFLMLYNTISQRDFGKFAKYDMVVLENSRTNALKDNTIKAEVLSVVQRPNNVDERGVAKIGDQKVFDLITKNAKDEEVVLGDSENLLGKVIRATVDGDKLVKVEVNKDYDYKYGDLTSATDKQLSINGEKYSVRIDERYYRRDRSRYDNDDRMFRTYVTDGRRAENYNYQKFARDFFDKNGKPLAKAPNFVRATIKDGMVMFVDTFAMKDIAPVADVKRDGKDVYFYNDLRNGSVDRMTPAKRVIGFTAEKGFYNMSEKDIKKDDVIHMMDGVTLVRQDAIVEGKLNGTYVNRDGEFATIEKEDYFLSSAVDVKAPLRSVYAYDDQHYRTTQNRGNINAMVKSDVKALLDISGNIQLITSHNKYTDTVGIVKTFNSNYPVFFAPNGEKEYNLDVVRDTRIFRFEYGTTGAQREHSYEPGDLVYTTDAGEGKAGIIAMIKKYDTVKRLATPAKFSDRYNRYFLHEIRNSASETGFRTGMVRFDDDTRVFAFNKNEDFVQMSMSDIIKYNSPKENPDLKAYVMNEAQFRAFVENILDLGRYNYYGDRTDLAKIVVFFNVKGAGFDLKDLDFGRVARIDNYNSSVDIEVQRGVVERFDLATRADKDFFRKAKLGDIVAFREFKEVKEGENKKATEFKFYKDVKDVVVVEGPVQYNGYNSVYGTITVNGSTFHQSSYTKVYGNVGDRYAIVYAIGEEADAIIYTNNPANVKVRTELTAREQYELKRLENLVKAAEKSVAEGADKTLVEQQISAAETQLASFSTNELLVRAAQDFAKRIEVLRKAFPAK